MLKFSAGFINHRGANLIGLGLTDDNLRIMLTRQKPVYVTSQELSLPEPGFRIGIIAAKDFGGIERTILSLCREIYGIDEGNEPEEAIKIPCMNMEDKFWLFPFIDETTGTAAYVLALTEDRFPLLRRSPFTFRVRSTVPDFVPVEVLMFWGSSEDSMEETFYAAGLISHETKVRRVTDTR